MECSVSGCHSKIKARGLCSKHYYRFRKYGKDYSPYHTEETRHPLYETWRGMQKRCYESYNGSYRYYGAKGIKVCDRWLGENGFKHFLEDMGEKPKGCTLDRVDSNKDYSPENCRWADKATQNLNRRHVLSEPYIYKVDGTTWEVYIRRVDKHFKKRYHSFEDAKRGRDEWLAGIENGD